MELAWSEAVIEPAACISCGVYLGELANCWRQNVLFLSNTVGGITLDSLRFVTVSTQADRSDSVNWVKCKK